MRALIPALVILTLAASGYGADQTVLGRKLEIKDSKPDIDPTKRKIVGQGKETHSTNMIVGDPTVSGATITFFANGTTSSTQAFSLPASLWSAAGTTGFKYKDSALAVSPVKTAQIKASRGTVQIKSVVLGKTGGITLTPPNLGTDACILVSINGGDSYHILFPAVPNSAIKKNDAKTFLVKSALVEGLCPSPTTTSTSTTTTSTSTTSTTVPACGTFLTTWGTAGSGNGQFDLPAGVATDGSGNVYVADAGNNRIQKFACP